LVALGPAGCTGGELGSLTEITSENVFEKITWRV
jgi:hypothetical protein